MTNEEFDRTIERTHVWVDRTMWMLRFVVVLWCCIWTAYTYGLAVGRWPMDVVACLLHAVMVLGLPLASWWMWGLTRDELREYEPKRARRKKRIAMLKGVGG